MRRVVVVLLLLSGIPGEAADSCKTGKKPEVTAAIPDLQGSHFSQRRQNEEADLRNLERIKDLKALSELRQKGMLVSLPVTHYLKVDYRLDPQWHWCRPWTARFLDDLAARFYYWHQKPIIVNSAVRTIDRQKAIARSNVNAAAVEGDRASSHLVGSTVDIAKKHLTREQIEWLRMELLDLEERGYLEATEEHNQAVFHIMVFDRYYEYSPR